MISVLIPVYNSSLFIRETIFSVLNQTYQDFELLIYDDYSSDNSVEVIMEFHDERIRLFKGNENLGVRYARDYLLSKALGDFICFLDSDDIFYKTKLAKQIEFFDTNPNIDVLGTAVSFIDENSKSIFFPFSFQSNAHDEIFVNLFFANTIATSTVIFKSVVKYDINFMTFPFNIAEDYFIWATLSTKYKIANLKDSLVSYRVTKNSLMQSSRNNYLPALNLVHTYFFDKFALPQYYLDIHNRYIHQNLKNVYYLKKSIVYFDILIKANLVFEPELLLKQIRISWFRRCLNYSKSDQLFSLYAYFKYFKYHNHITLLNGFLLGITCIYQYSRSKFSIFK